MKLIYVLRHPIERMRAHYLHARWQRMEHRTADAAFLQHPDYLHTSRYAFQIEAWLEHFPREQLLVLTSDALMHQRPETLACVQAFLGVDDCTMPANIDFEAHRTSDKRISRRRVAPLVDSGRWRQARGSLPEPLQRVHDQVFMQAATSDLSRIRPATEAVLLRHLAEDIALLRAYLPPDFDGWGIA